ncbi:ROK family protein [Richelia sinica FACHB-800]|uniref:ROK family protein n=1 Tax=Richelia sinica FACHB-800 TaxID=1357546 RepID=A0A975T822_9NOST|nr:ROK family protein [Richelia sinica]MBD2665959.1 ROK family protein [Richelia sinica FACHB-800]QXE23928.1 ROK family protein [Richelia sinica FACHB-800]
MLEDNGSVRTLSVDIGGSGVKTMVLDITGKPLTERGRLETPQPATPEVVINAIAVLAANQGEFHRVSVGFPGVVRSGVTETAVNLHSSWVGFDLATELSHRLDKPVRVINDADMQGLGAIAGKGVELVITLGTGFGSALFVDGKLVPNMEMGHHYFRKGKTYEQQLGRAALEKIGEKKWNKRLKKAINSLQHLFNYDCLYIGGGEAVRVNLELPLNVKLIPNITGLLGGIALWRN